jgi:hypothetical protein
MAAIGGVLVLLKSFRVIDCSWWFVTAQIYAPSAVLAALVLYLMITFKID